MFAATSLLLALLLALLLPACGPDDADEDGYSPPLDCDDDAPGVHPGAAEACNGLDDNCDGAVDEGAPADAPTWYADADGDGVGAAAPTWVGCVAPAGWVPTGDDCDDADPAVHPEAAEICGNGLDDDCDGLPGDCRLVGELSAAEADYVLVGPWLASAGFQLDLGDVTGDGKADLVVGEPGVYDSNEVESAVWVWSFPLPSPRVMLAAAPTVLGDSEESGLGSDVTLADLDGDGVGDLVVSTPEESYAYPNEGLVLAWYGGLPQGAGWWWGASSYLYGGPDAYEFGEALAVGDFDADGDPDLAASCPYDDYVTTNGGSVSVFTGPLAPLTRGSRDSAALRLDGVTTSGYFGLRIQTLPDADGDGDDELIVASPTESGGATNSGVVRVYSRLLRGDDELDDAAFTVRGTSASEGLGWVGDVGDLDGDGQGDLVLGTSWGGDGAGLVLAWFGPLQGTVDALAEQADLAVVGAVGGGHFGDAVGVDDVDGDGHEDLLVGTNSLGEGVDSRGYLAVYYGPFSPGTLGPDDADLVIAGVEPEAWFGYGEPRAADLDGDGAPELVVAAPLADLQGSASDTGVIYVFRGRGL